MKLFQTMMLFIGASQGTIKIAINDQKFESTAFDIGTWAGNLEASHQYQNYTEALHQAQMHAKLEIAVNQKAILKPVIKDLKNYVKLFSPNKNCNVNGLAQCIINFQGQAQESDSLNGMQNCSVTNECQDRWEGLSMQQKMHLEQKFNSNDQQLHAAMNQLGQDIYQQFADATEEQEANAEYIQDQFKNESTHLLKSWGCNSTCVDSWSGADWNIQAAIQQCDCPSGIKYNVTNEPFADVNLDEMDKVDDKLGSNIRIHNAILRQTAEALNSKDAQDALQVALLFQLVICFVICGYAQRKIDQSRNSEQTQQSGFYDFLYKYHEQMADEAGQQMQMGGGSSGTPGGTPQ